MPEKATLNAFDKEEAVDKKPSMFRPDNAEEPLDADTVQTEEVDDEEDMETEENGPKVAERLRDRDKNQKDDTAMDVDVQDDDPLDAFMNGITDEVRRVDEEDMRNHGDTATARTLAERLEDESEEETEEVVEDDIDKASLRPEDILACVYFQNFLF